MGMTADDVSEATDSSWEPPIQASHGGASHNTTVLPADTQATIEAALRAAGMAETLEYRHAMLGAAPPMSSASESWGGGMGMTADDVSEATDSSWEPPIQASHGGASHNTTVLPAGTQSTIEAALRGRHGHDCGRCQ
eukprot:TRINITY_DN5153_c0_g1_i7.p1 TRINITY_DN5153_c0_g1~~TRINITY_DN5153_c0_g1_i7.p1  ORF type:complete len:137 (+),score=38.43 TRINITY_DN5153_c0_g1_i7:2-412(+)